MNRIQRKTIALCMSFVLLIFTICQAQAKMRVVLPCMAQTAGAVVVAAGGAERLLPDVPAALSEALLSQSIGPGGALGLVRHAGMSRAS
jgi:hypothetical protein